MNPLRWNQVLLFLFLAGLTACSSGPSDEESIAVMVALTQTSATGATEAVIITAPETTEVLDEVPPGDFQPLSPDECEQLAAFMVNRLPVPPVEQGEVAVEHEGVTGVGCQALAVGTGEVFPDMMVVEEAMRGILRELGWNEDPTAPTCLGIGGWGPGASTRCYVQADALCEVFVHVNPVDGALCPDDEPIFVCLERLDPGQIVYTLNLTCARDTEATE
ncbi:MAG: hypothetical protein ACERKY_12620 [Anaerolineales bacterium]